MDTLLAVREIDDRFSLELRYCPESEEWLRAMILFGGTDIEKVSLSFPADVFTEMLQEGLQKMWSMLARDERKASPSAVSALAEPAASCS